MCAWSSPRSYTAGEIITASILNTHLRDQLRYLKGLDGLPTIESGLIIDNTGGDEYLKLPLLSTAEVGTTLGAEGKVAFDETTHQVKIHNGTAVKAVISEADVDDTPVNGADTVPVSSNWAYDFQQTLTTGGDMPYATAAGVWARLGITNSRYLYSVGGVPTWASGTMNNKLLSHTRAMDAASGDVSYTTYGFQPRALIIFAGAGLTGGSSWGFGDVNLAEMCLIQSELNQMVISTSIIVQLTETYNTKAQSAVLKTLDADGFTLTWTRTGATATGTGTFIVLALA